MNPILFIIYHFLKGLTKTTFRIFFSKTTIINKESLKVTNATIIVSNHPNTLLDPLNTAAYVDSIIYFLANSGLFEPPVFGPILSKLYTIPIQRQKDSNSRGITNGESFERCDEFLSDGGCLYIAPEGTSEMEYRLRQLKTGTARIALRAESKTNFQLGLTILPVGLTYSDPSNFRSEVLVNAGKTIQVADYQILYEEDNFIAARKLTEELYKVLGDLIYNTENADEEAFIKKIKLIIDNEYPVEAENAFFRTKEYIAKTRELKLDDAESYLELTNNVIQYFAVAESLKINDKAVAFCHKKENSGLNILLLILGFPFFIYGYINNFLAFYTPAFLAKKLNLFVGYTSTVKALSGIFTVPIFYGLQIWLVQSWFGNPTLSIIYALSLLPLGWLSWQYMTFAKQFFKNYKASRLWKRGDKKMSTLVESRKSLVKSLTSISSVAKL